MPQPDASAVTRLLFMTIGMPRAVLLVLTVLVGMEGTVDVAIKVCR